MCHEAHQASFYSTAFCSMKRLGVFLLPLDRMPVHYRVTPPPPHIINLSVPIYTPEWILRHCDSKVSRQKTQYSQGSQPGLEPKLRKIEKKYKSHITGCLHRLPITLKTVYLKMKSRNKSSPYSPVSPKLTPSH